MRLSRILMRQIVTETSTYTVLAFTAVVLTLLGQNLIRRMDALTTIGLTSADLLVVVGSLVVMLTPYAVPIAFLFGCLVCLRRMAADGEILAMRTNGMGSITLLIPTIVLGLIISLLCGYLMLFAEFDSRRQLVTVFKQAAIRGGGLEAGAFRNLGHKIVYVDDHNREGELEGVMIVDYSNPEMLIRVFAETGTVSFDDSTQLLHFELRNGDVQLQQAGQGRDKFRRLAFEDFDFPYDISHLLGSAFAPNRPRQMSLEELANVIELAKREKLEDIHTLHENDPSEYAIERQRRFTLPLVPLLFALIAVPLGQRVSRGGRAWGVVLCIAVVAVYYVTVIGSESLVRADFLPAQIALWIPNGLLASLATLMIIRDETAAPQ